MSDFEEDDISFDYEDDEDNNSGFSFESDDENEQNIYEFEDRITEASTNSHEDSAMIGCNGTSYLPWTLQMFIQCHFLEPLKRLQKVQLNSCSEDDLLIMLHYKKWQVDEVINAFFENHDKLFENCGLPVGKSTNNKFEELEDYDCPICCETYTKGTFYSLTCDHKFCFNCYYQYLKNEIVKGHAGLITCMVPDCNYSIPHKDIAEIITLREVGENPNPISVEQPLTSNPLLLASARTLIGYKSKKYVWCPTTDCESFTELLYDPNRALNDEKSVDISKVPIVGCTEHHEFCFQCVKENHLPCPCWVTQKWIKKCNDDSETANWIDANTHSCPKCHSSIEKNGGCNHMTCRKCKHEFCWVCLNDWTEHRNNYSCNRFRDDKVEDDIRKNRSRQTLERYLHFYKRFAIHENSMKADQKTLKNIEEVTRLYMEDRRESGQLNLSWNDIQFLLDAMRSLQNGRKTLKWTYCFAYYLKKSNFSQIFETNQDFLNQTVEDLSEIFEKIMDKKNKNKVDTIIKNKVKIINLSELVSSRQKTLIKSAEENLQHGLLSFET
ncbi:dbl4 E3 ubiquitin-protein ligase dbl4 [Candida maltosa Xu316]